jgi:hypothetical protein
MKTDLKTQAMLDELAKRPLSSWVHEMLVHYRRTGAFRREDLRRLLGSQSANNELLQDVFRAMRLKKN